jgi:outer membrane protein insertion porin family
MPLLWNGWRLLPPYRQESVDADVARLLSGYLQRGYLDAEVHAAEPRLQGRDVQLAIVAHPGKLYPIPTEFCGWLLSQRRDAERDGVLDFSARFDFEHGISIERGPGYRVGRIDFAGNRHYTDGFLRANLLLDEGDVFDEQRLRRSVARLNRAQRFEPIDERNVVVRPNPRTGIADISIHVRERKAGAWNISGPVGPMSLAGPLQASLSSRLPPWGRGVLELSTYTASIGFYAFAKPLIPIVAPPKRFIPVLAIQRAFSPGEGWKSGFVMAPQLGWKNGALSYASTQLQGRLMPMVGGERSAGPDLPVIVTRRSGEAVMYCAPAPPRFKALRAGVGLALHVLGALPAF